MGKPPKKPGNAPGGTRHGRGLGHGGDARGPGWGGSAKGVGTGDRPAFAPGNKVAAGRVAPGDLSGPDVQRRLRDAERAEEIKETLYDMAKNAENEAIRLQAKVHYLDRVEGKPIARNVTVEAEAFTVVFEK